MAVHPRACPCRGRHPGQTRLRQVVKWRRRSIPRSRHLMRHLRASRHRKPHRVDSWAPLQTTAAKIAMKARPRKPPASRRLCLPRPTHRRQFPPSASPPRRHPQSLLSIQQSRPLQPLLSPHKPRKPPLHPLPHQPQGQPRSLHQQFRQSRRRSRQPGPRPLCRRAKGTGPASGQRRGTLRRVQRSAASLFWNDCCPPRSAASATPCCSASATSSRPTSLHAATRMSPSTATNSPAAPSSVPRRFLSQPRAVPRDKHFRVALYSHKQSLPQSRVWYLLLLRITPCAREGLLLFPLRFNGIGHPLLPCAIYHDSIKSLFLHVSLRNCTRHCSYCY
eukprot:m.84172 g.84172  ORF g.84172 m.84172 type:complete len:334 (+) comp8189_c0_seq1:675-1676(+)